MDETSISVVGRDDVGAPVRDPDVAAVLLAAGTSTRFGRANKLLASFDDESVVRRATRTLTAAGVGTVTVVVGHQADRVRNALDGLDVRFVDNPRYEEGLATSVCAGVEAVRDEADAAVFALGDMPLVRPATVTLLVDAYRADVGDALAAGYRGRRGNPVLFDARYFDRLCAESGDRGGRRALFENDRAAVVETDDPGVLADVDDRDDLDSLQ